MFPNSYYAPSYFPPGFWERPGGSPVVKHGAGGQIVADRYKRIYRMMMLVEHQRSVLTELDRMRKKEGKQTVEVLNHLQIRAEEANRQAVQRAAIYCAILSEA